MNNFNFDNLGGMAKAMIADLLEKSDHVFLMKWDGKKVPFKATIGGTEVHWIQGGSIANGLGLYERLVENGGDNQQKQVLLIGTRYDQATNPDGSRCEDYTDVRGLWKIAVGKKVEYEYPKAPNEATTDITQSNVDSIETLKL